MREPKDDLNPLDKASFYIEQLKYGEGPGKVEQVSQEAIAAQMDSLLSDAGITFMSGTELMEASKYYGMSCAESFRLDLPKAWSVFLDGLMHGIAFTAGLESDFKPTW